MHEVLVNHLGGLSLPRKSVVRLTDRPDMTLDVYRGRKTTIQQYSNSSCYLHLNTLFQSVNFVYLSIYSDCVTHKTECYAQKCSTGAYDFVNVLNYTIKNKIQKDKDRIKEVWE